MRKSLVMVPLVVLVLILVLSGALARPANADEEQEDRILVIVRDLSSLMSTQQAQIAGLETRVAVLETQVASPNRASAPQATTTASVQTISGVVRLRQRMHEELREIGPCTGYDGFDDIHGGTDIVVRDGAGAILAAGALGPGEYVESDAVNADTLIFHCLFPFTLEGIPTSDFYVISIGRRGDLTYTHEELVALSWEVELSIGDNT